MLAMTSDPHVQARDGVAPTLSMIRFVDADTVEATFSEGIADPSSDTFEVHDMASGGTAAATSTGAPTRGPATGATANTILTFNLDMQLPPGDYHVDLAGVTDDASPTPNAYDATDRDAVTYTVPDTTAPTFTARTATTMTLTITFDEPVSGDTAAGEWTVEGAGALTPGETTLSLDTTLTLTYTNALGTGAAPTVEYSGSVLADAAGNMLAMTASPHVQATDGIAPTLSGIAFTDADTIEATFSEGIADPAAVTFEVYSAMTGGTLAATSTGAPTRGTPCLRRDCRRRVGRRGRRRADARRDDA